ANPFWPFPSGMQPEIDRQRIILTIVLLVILGAMFMRGFREVIGLAVVLVAVYLVLNVIVIGSGLVYLLGHPQRLDSWHQRVFVEGEWHLREAPLPGHGT